MIERKTKISNSFQCYLLPNLYFRGPEDTAKPYASLCVLDPIITVERHHGKYHVAARFNVEATILNYENSTR
jgi:hypothetical protein